jgi:CRP/FNR family transcriptional regulator, anaerobic regulatory protein
LLSQNALGGALSEIKGFALFAGFSDDLILNLCANSEIKVHKHKEQVFTFGNPASSFGIVLSGAYKLSRIAISGEESVIHFSSPGDVVAALVMPQVKPIYPVNVTAMGPSRILLIHRDTYLERWLRNPDLIIRIQGLLSTRMSRFQNQKIMQRAPLASKVAALLLQLVSKDTNKDELEVPLPLTRKEIADTLGVTVESVIRVMSEWVKKGYVVTTDQYIKILKPDQLIAQVDD